MYYNTVDETGKTLEDYISKAISQDMMILSVFCLNRGKLLTPWNVQKLLYDNDPSAPYPIPITSIRRSITNLTDAGQIEKTRHKQLGALGRMNFAWVYKEPYIQTSLEL